MTDTPLLPPGKAYYEAWHRADERMRPPGMAVPDWESLSVGVQNEWVIMDEVARGLYDTRAPLTLSTEERAALVLAIGYLGTAGDTKAYPAEVILRALLARTEAKP